MLPLTVRAAGLFSPSALVPVLREANLEAPVPFPPSRFRVNHFKVGKENAKKRERGRLPREKKWISGRTEATRKTTSVWVLFVRVKCSTSTKRLYGPEKTWDMPEKGAQSRLIRRRRRAAQESVFTTRVTPKESMELPISLAVCGVSIYPTRDSRTSAISSAEVSGKSGPTGREAATRGRRRSGDAKRPPHQGRGAARGTNFHV